jgi:K+-sensing histidine kinase KdpD
VERAVKIARHSVVDRDIELHLDRWPMLVECDPHLLDRAVSNVLVSVMQHADAGHPVEVRLVHEEEVARLHVRCDGSAVPVSELARMVSQLSGAACRPAGEAGAAGTSLRVTGRVTVARDGAVEGCTGPDGTTLSVTFALARADGQPGSTPAVRSTPASTFIAP